MRKLIAVVVLALAITGTTSACGWRGARVHKDGTITNGPCDKRPTQLPCPYHVTSPTPKTTLHEAPFGHDCKPIEGVDNQCTIEVDDAGAPGCDIRHHDGVYEFECDGSAGWTLLSRTKDGKHGGCFMHRAADVDLVACADGYRDRIKK